MRSTRSAGVGNCLFLRSRGWRIEHQERKKIVKLPETQITHTWGGRLSLAPVDMQYPWERAVLLSFNGNVELKQRFCRLLQTEKLKRLATFDSLSVQMRLAARSRMQNPEAKYWPLLKPAYRAFTIYILRKRTLYWSWLKLKRRTVFLWSCSLFVTLLVPPQRF